MTPSKTRCPVPEEQRPETEYKVLKKSFSFSWASSNSSDFFKTLFIILLNIYTISIIIFLSSYKVEFNSYVMFFQVPIFANTIFILILLRVYLGWNYVYDRLLSATVTYEESGWYDGQIWVKTNDTLTQDRLIGTYQLLPILKRLQLTIIICSVTTFTIICMWNFIIK